MKHVRCFWVPRDQTRLLQELLVCLVTLDASVWYVWSVTSSFFELIREGISTLHDLVRRHGEQGTGESDIRWTWKREILIAAVKKDVVQHALSYTKHIFLGNDTVRQSMQMCSMPRCHWAQLALSIVRARRVTCDLTWQGLRASESKITYGSKPALCH